MRRLSKWVVLVSIVFGGFAQAGDINIGTPLVSGEVATFESGQKTSHRELSRGQLQALSIWLGGHRSEWHGMATEATNEASALQLNLKDNDGKMASISIVEQADGRHYLRLMSADTWSYRSFGGLVKSRAATRPLSDKEFAILQKILGRVN
jgi:hypothetical protein